jgi:hypothetical protein
MRVLFDGRILVEHFQAYIASSPVAGSPTGVSPYS